MKQAMTQSILIVVIALVLSVASFFGRSDVLALDSAAYELELPAALQLGNALWVDARVDSDFETAHYTGAILVNEEDWEAGFASLLENWVPDSPIVVYCSSQSCLRSHHVAERLRAELGVEEVYALHGGWEALLEAGLAGGGER